MDNDVTATLSAALLDPMKPLNTPLGEVQAQCETHGAYTSIGTRYGTRREIWTKCALCEAQRVDFESRQQIQKAAQARQEKLASMLGSVGIPELYDDSNFENYQIEYPNQQLALEILVAFAKNFDQHLSQGDCLILMGLPGTGKTHLAVSVLKAVLPTYCGIYTDCLSMVRAVRRAWSPKNDLNESDVYELYGSTPLLVLDEVGLQRGTDNEKEILFGILNERYNKQLPTIFLTNMDSMLLFDFLGERTYDRLRQTARQVTFTWPSYRSKARLAKIAGQE